MSLTIGVDIGGTKVAAGVVDAQGQLLAQQRRGTPAHSSDQLLEVIVEVIETLRNQMHEQGKQVQAVGVAAAGMVDQLRATVVHAPNLAGWSQEPLKARISQRIPLPIVVENDANAAAWAEVLYGSAQGFESVVCVTVGTGVGGGVIIGGHLMRGHWGCGAELGHLKVLPEGQLCGCGQRGCLEQYASGTALVREAQQRAQQQPQLGQRLLALGDGTPQGITGPHVTQAALQGDQCAVNSFIAVGTWLGRGMADYAAVLDPQCFVVGGGLSETGDLLLEPVRQAYAQYVPMGSLRPMALIVAASLGNEAGIIGAACLARELV